MKVKANKTISVEDFPEQKEWLGRLASPINDFITDVVKILNGGSLFADQARGKEHEFKFTYQSDTISLPVGFAWTIAQAPKALNVVWASEDGDPVILLTSWTFTEKGQVQLTQVVRVDTTVSPPVLAALQASVEYKIRVRVTP
jgi:hypothetical protein